MAAAKDFGQGIFDMEFIHSVNGQTDLAKAKQMCMDKIEASSATDANKRKARAMVQLSNTTKNLLLGLTNFSLSHQGLKTI